VYPAPHRSTWSPHDALLCGCFSCRLHRRALDYRHFWGQDLEVNVAGADITANSDYDQVMATLGWGF